MAKRRKVKVVDLAEWPIGLDFNWSLCVICQTHTGQPLITATADGCRSLAENLNAFSKSGSLPSTVRIQHMDDGSGLQQTLSKKVAKYHKVCRTRYISAKLKHPEQSKSDASTTTVDESKSEILSRNTRSSSNFVDIKTVCIFCDCSHRFSKDKLHSALTLGIGPNI